MSQTPRRWSQTTVHVLLCANVGLALAALNLWLLQRATPSAHRLLFGPKLWFSSLLARMRGWDVHAAYHEPMGLWFQIGCLVGVVVLLGMLLIRLLRVGYWGDSRLAWVPAVVAASVPWLVVLTCGQWEADLPGGPPGVALAALAFAGVLSVSATGVLLLASRSRAWGVTCLSLTAVLWLTLVAREMDFHTRPLAYASLIVAAVAVPVWLSWRTPTTN